MVSHASVVDWKNSSQLEFTISLDKAKKKKKNKSPNSVVISLLEFPLILLNYHGFKSFNKAILIP